MATGRTDVSALYSKSEQQKRELNAVLESFAEQKTSQKNVAEQQRLAAMVSQFASTVDLYGQEVSALTDKSRALWERRLANLQDDLAAIQKDADKQLGHFYRKQKEDDDRNKLFDGRQTKKSADDDMQYLAKEHRSLRDSSTALDDVIDQGQRILGNLVGQNKILKNARRKLLDAANVMGVSASLVSVIDRRQTADKWLVYGGMVFTLFILFSLWYLLRW
uniref:Golgi SNAP receptor complex member 2 n=1 Tax=Pyrodinium bahamense TaxID=73915 RepID=A0A7R9ZYC0_9DINO